MFHVIWVPYTLATDWGGCYKFDEILLGSYNKLLPDDLQERALTKQCLKIVVTNFAKSKNEALLFSTIATTLQISNCETSLK